MSPTTSSSKKERGLAIHVLVSRQLAGSEAIVVLRRGAGPLAVVVSPWAVDYAKRRSERRRSDLPKTSGVSENGRRVTNRREESGAVGQQDGERASQRLYNCKTKCSHRRRAQQRRSPRHTRSRRLFRQATAAGRSEGGAVAAEEESERLCASSSW